MSVMIGIPVKNSAVYLKKLLPCLDKLTYPDISRVVFEYGHSVDNTLEVIKKWSKRTKLEVEVYKEPSMNLPGLPITAMFIDAVYKDFQSLFKEDYFLLLDSDIIDIPSNYLESLIGFRVDVIAPYVWMSRHYPRLFYDSYVFRYKGYKFHPLYPPGLDREILEVDSVGSTYLASREAFLSGEFNRPHPHLHFCNSVRSKGYKVYVTSKVNVYHEDLEREGKLHFPLEFYLGGKIEYTPYIDYTGRVWSQREFEKCLEYYSILKQLGQKAFVEYCVTSTGKTLRWHYNFQYFRAFWMTRHPILKNLLFEVVPYPSFIEIEHTTVCNIRCKMCEHTYWNEPSLHMSFERFKSIVDQFPELKWVGLTGIGESFLNPDFMKMVRYLKERDVYIELCDNFYTPTKEQLRELIELGVERVFASIDAGTKETYEKIRVGAKWDKVWENVVFFDREIKRVGRPFPELCFHYITTKDNIHEVMQYLELIHKLGINARVIRIARILHPFREVSDLFVEIPEELKDRILKKAEELKLPVVWDADTVTNKPPISDCTAWMTPFILIDGTVVACCYLNEQNDREWQRRTSMGNVFVDSFPSIWYGGKYRELREALRKGSVTELCSRCPICSLESACNESSTSAP